MPISYSAEPIYETDAALWAMLADAELPSLLPALACITGDLALLDPRLRPPLRSTDIFPAPQGGMSPEDQSTARQLAFEALKQFRDGGSRMVADVDQDVMRQAMTFITGPIDDDYLGLLAQELGLPVDSGAPQWSASEIAPDRRFSVAVIGAGMSGLLAAHRLAQAGVDLVVFEKNDDVGGTWLENTYPGCRLDTNNFAYSYSFAQADDWPQQFSPRDAIFRYFRSVSEALDVRKHIRFGTKVQAASFDDTSKLWHLRVDSGGREEVVSVNAIISAVGQLNEPNYPDIPGRDRFQGESVHTARWSSDVPLDGRRVAVIGTGASAYQVIPEIESHVGELSIFQRHAPWMIPTPNYHDDIPGGLAWLFRHVPYYHRWFRFYQFWTSVEGRHSWAQVDEAWKGELSVSEKNERLRRFLTEHLERQFADRPDLLAKVVPNYPPFAKRIVRDNGLWARTLKREHVHLVTDSILEITEKGIVTEGGVEHEVDVIVYGTGFRASEFLGSIDVKGAGGADLQDFWRGEPRAFAGVEVPNFPNLFLLYGPNTNLVVNGSIILFSEFAMNFVLESIKGLLGGRHEATTCTMEAYADFNLRIDDANQRMAWGASGVSSWYKSASGRVSQNWPLALIEYYRVTRAPQPRDHVYL